MSHFKLQSLKVFIPAKNFDESLQFYREIGFELVWESPDLALFQHCGQQFFLQNFYVKELAENLMMHVTVDSVESCFKVFNEKVKDLAGKITPPKEEPWGQKVSYLTDPSGVLWHLAENLHRVGGDLTAPVLSHHRTYLRIRRFQ